MGASTRYDAAFDGPGRIAATLGMIELVVGGVLLARLSRLSMTLSVIVLIVLLVSIVVLCVVTVPRRIQVPMIAGLMILFVITGAQLDLFDEVNGEIAEHQAGPEGARLIAPTRALDPTAAAIDKASGGGTSPGGGQGGGGSGDGGWASDLAVATASVGPDGGVRAIVSSMVVDRAVEPNRVSFDWTIVAGASRKYCGSITMAAADRQVALDHVAATVRTAIDRSRATGTAICY